MHTSVQFKIPVFTDWSTLGIFPRVSCKYMAFSLNGFHININISVIMVTVNINHKLVHNIRAGCVFVTTPYSAGDRFMSGYLLLRNVGFKRSDTESSRFRHSTIPTSFRIFSSFVLARILHPLQDTIQVYDLNPSHWLP
jgi:hypothetical protein